MSLTAISAASHLSAALFTAASGGTSNPKLTTAIDDCGTVVPHKWPGGGNPPPPPPFDLLKHFAGVELPRPTRGDDGWCGTVPHKFPFPFPPPPPSPLVDGINQMLGAR